MTNENSYQYIISDDKSLLQAEQIIKMLRQTYWAQNRSEDIILKSIDNSLCFGVYYNNLQIGFARVITDYATVYYICDVIIEETFRGKELGKKLVQAVIENDRLKPLVGMLATKDAHGLYEKYGFVRNSENFMKRPVI